MIEPGDQVAEGELLLGLGPGGELFPVSGDLLLAEVGLEDLDQSLLDHLPRVVRRALGDCHGASHAFDVFLGGVPEGLLGTLRDRLALFGGGAASDPDDVEFRAEDRAKLHDHLLDLAVEIHLKGHGLPQLDGLHDGFLDGLLIGGCWGILGRAASTFCTMVVLTSTVVDLGTSCGTATFETTTSWSWASASAEVKVAHAAIVESKNKRSLVFMAASQ